MEYYKVRLKLAKNILPKFKEEDLQWTAVKNLIKDGKAEIILLEQSDEEFDRPKDTTQYNEWNKKFSSDYFIEDTLLLNSEESQNQNFIYEKFYNNLNRSNILDYSYTNDDGRFESFAFFDDSNIDYSEMLSKEEKEIAKKNVTSKLTPEEIAKKKQIKMFKNKK